MGAELEWYTLRELAELVGRSAGTLANWLREDRRKRFVRDDQVDYRTGPRVKVLASGRLLRLRTLWLRGDAAQSVIRRRVRGRLPWARRR